MERLDGRAWNETRKIEIVPDFLKFAQSSVLISFGHTKVVVSATLEEGVPPFLDPVKEGWLTAEYGLLPASCGRRIKRPIKGVDGRSKEIQRLIGRSLRAVINRKCFPGYTIVLDCDVMQGDGGTRTAAINGAYVAAFLLFENRKNEGMIERNPFEKKIAAVSAGYVKEGLLLDLCYEEDHRAIVDANFTMTDEEEIVELQVSGEKGVINEEQLGEMINCCKKGIGEIIRKQDAVISDYFN